VASSVGVDVVPINPRDENELESGVTKITRRATVTVHRGLILKLAARYRLPIVYANRTFVDNGVPVSYGSDFIASSRLAAGYVDRILKGEKPADLPVQAPTRYELVVNLKTAKIPSTVLARAEEVIE
jgi:putative ABC transport system substrate-binding protein